LPEDARSLGAGGTVTIHGCTIEVDAIYDTRA